jgi:cytochrome d ubiquinol oxidase subunit II
VLIAIFILVIFAAHGAVGLAQRTEGTVRGRSLQLASRLWRIVAVLLVITAIATRGVRSDFFARVNHQPLGLLGVMAIFGGLVVVFRSLKRQREAKAFIGSSAFISGLVISGAAGVFPFMLRSTLDPQYSLSAYQTAADGHGLALALVWWPLAFCFAVGYFFFTFRYYSGKVDAKVDTQAPY